MVTFKFTLQNYDKVVYPSSLIDTQKGEGKTKEVHFLKLSVSSFLPCPYMTGSPCR